MIYDALVIGGGPAGTTASLLLAQAGWSVALVERSVFPRRKVCGEFISATSLDLLETLGVAAEFFIQAGPEIRRVGVFAGASAVTAPMPVPDGGRYRWGRALGREHLDLLLLQRAASAGAELWQPWTVTALRETHDNVCCTLLRRQPEERRELTARVIIAAQGSWDPDVLPGQEGGSALKPSDLFGFKAHFQGGSLDLDLMPLLAFPGGYGGMVRTDAGRISLSCCIGRGQLQRCRESQPGKRAAEAVLGHILGSCRGAADALRGASIQDPWLAVGPIRPGFRPLRQGRIFLAGNAAGEAHPVIAEGISLALQSAWLLARNLIACRDAILEGDLEVAGRRYAAAWRRQFAARIRRSALIAHLAMQPAATAAVLPAFRLCPVLLTLCTRYSGKTRPLLASARVQAVV